MTQDVPMIAVIMNLFLFISICYLTFLVIRRYQESRAKATLLLALVLGLWGAAMFMHLLGTFLVFSFHSWFEDAGARVGTHAFSASAYVFIAAGNVFLLLFTFEVFAKDKFKWVIPYCGLCILDALLVLYHIFDNPWDNTGDYIPWTYFAVFHFILTVIGYGTTFNLAFRVSRKTEDLLYKKGLQFLALFPIFVFVALISYTIDVTGPLKEIPYSIFYYLGGILLIIAAVFSYIGTNMPPWFRRRYEKS